MAVAYPQPATAAPTMDELHRRLGDYLTAQTDRAAFVNWFLSWSIDRRPEAGTLEARVEMLVAEHTSGHGDEAAFKEALAAAVIETTQVRFTEVPSVKGFSSAGTEPARVSWSESLRPR